MATTPSTDAAADGRRFHERAAAKINLTLRVLGRRPDGYHELESMVAFLTDGDHVTLEVGGEPGHTTSGPFAAAIEGENLIDRALQLLGERDPGLRIGHVRLDKCLPVASGIGGGSADAAAVLRAVRRANPERADGFDWMAVAASLGADVPVCLTSRASLMTGLGDVVVPLEVETGDDLGRLWCLLANPQIAMPSNKTGLVFKALAAPPLAAPQLSTPPHSALPFSASPGTTHRAFSLATIAAVGNDLEAPALGLWPIIGRVKARLAESRGCLHAALSGAGPTCFALYANEDDLAAARSAIHAAEPGWWLMAGRLG